MHPTRPDGTGWSGVALTAAVIGVLALVVLSVPDLRTAASAAMAGDTEAVRSDIRDAGPAGVLLLMGLMLVHAVVLFPAEIVTAASGFVYGVPLGLGLVMAGWTLSAAATYAIGRAAGRPLLYRLAGETRFLDAERKLHDGGVVILLVVRFIPFVPFSLVGYVAGAARLPLWRFVWTTAVGYFPLCAATVVLGARLDAFSLEDPVVWAAVLVLAALVASAVVLPRWMARHERRRKASAGGPKPGSGAA